MSFTLRVSLAPGGNVQPSVDASPTMRVSELGAAIRRNLPSPLQEKPLTLLHRGKIINKPDAADAALGDLGLKAGGEHLSIFVFIKEKEESEWGPLATVSAQEREDARALVSSMAARDGRARSDAEALYVARTMHLTSAVGDLMHDAEGWLEHLASGAPLAARLEALFGGLLTPDTMQRLVLGQQNAGPGASLGELASQMQAELSPQAQAELARLQELPARFTAQAMGELMTGGLRSPKMELLPLAIGVRVAQLLADQELHIPVFATALGAMRAELEKPDASPLSAVIALEESLAASPGMPSSAQYFLRALSRSWKRGLTKPEACLMGCYAEACALLQPQFAAAFGKCARAMQTAAPQGLSKACNEAFNASLLGDANSRALAAARQVPGLTGAQCFELDLSLGIQLLGCAARMMTSDGALFFAPPQEFAFIAQATRIAGDLLQGAPTFEVVEREFGPMEEVREDVAAAARALHSGAPEASTFEALRAALRAKRNAALQAPGSGQAQGAAYARFLPYLECCNALLAAGQRDLLPAGNSSSSSSSGGGGSGGSGGGGFSMARFFAFLELLAEPMEDLPPGCGTVHRTDAHIALAAFEPLRGMVSGGGAAPPPELSCAKQNGALLRLLITGARAAPPATAFSLDAAALGSGSGAAQIEQAQGGPRQCLVLGFTTVFAHLGQLLDTLDAHAGEEPMIQGTAVLEEALAMVGAPAELRALTTTMLTRLRAGMNPQEAITALLMSALSPPQ